MHPYKKAFIYDDYYSPDDIHKLIDIASEIKFNQETFNWYNKVFSQIDTFAVIRDLCYDGFDTAEDYEKYGDMFKRIEK